MDSRKNKANERGALLSINHFFSGLMDGIGMGNTLDKFGEWLKSNTRKMTDLEIEEARKVFGDLIPYHQIRIDENSHLASIGAWMHRSKGMGLALAHTIHFNRTINPAKGNPDMKWLIHELVHVAQYTIAGLRYVGEALHAQANAGYNYGGPNALKGKKMTDFNREQQACIAEDYYYMVLYGSLDANKYQHMIDDLRAGKL